MQLTIRWRLWLFSAAFCGTVLVGGAIGTYGIRSQRTALAQSEATTRLLDGLAAVEAGCADSFRAAGAAITGQAPAAPVACPVSAWLESDSVRAHLPPGQPQAEKLRAAERAYAAALDEVGARTRAADPAAASAALTGSLVPAYADVLAAGAALRRSIAVAAADELAVIVRRGDAVFLLAMIGTLAGAVLALLAGLHLAHSVTRPLQRVVWLIHELGRGHLSARSGIARHDEIGDLARTTDQLAADLRQHVVDVLRRFSAGDLSAEIACMDDADEIAPAMQAIHGSLTRLGREAVAVTRAARAGDLGARASTDGLQGAWAEILGGFNDALLATAAPLQEAVAVLEDVAGHDLTVRMRGDYRGDHARISNALNGALANLGEALAEVRASADQVRGAAAEITRGSEGLASGASEQASSLEEVSSSLQELASMTRQNAANAQEARSLADGADTAVKSGVGSVGRLAEAMERIKAASDSTAKIVKTIDEIAFQTNLLALNAAVEAARAGDAGKSFAVVAEEVRTLATRSAEAAKNTASLIENAVESAGEGVTLNGEALASLERIQERVTRVSAVMSEIAAASEQQSEGVGQINTAIEQMNGVTQQVAASSEESASTAEELASQAEQLRRLVGEFVLDAGPGDGARSARRPGAAGGAGGSRWRSAGGVPQVA